MSDYPDTPITREEQYLAAGLDGGDLPDPITREEQYLYEIATKMQGGGSSVNSVVTVTGTVAAPFGSIDPAELHTAITSNNATALMTVDATAIGVSDTLFLFAQPAAGSFLNFQAVGGMSAAGCSCASAVYSNITGDLQAVAALTQGVYSLLTDYAALLTTTLTVIYHPLPDSE